MLHLDRLPQQPIYIGDDIRIVVLEVTGRSVRIGIEAPSNVSVDREEIWLRKQHEQTNTADLLHPVVLDQGLSSRS